MRIFSSLPLALLPATICRSRSGPIHQLWPELLQRRHEAGLDDSGKELLGTILNAGQRMNVLIQDLLCLLAIVEGENARHQFTSMRIWRQRELTLLQSSIQDNGAIITHDPLPVMRVDRGQVVRLFQNLVGE